MFLFTVLLTVKHVDLCSSVYWCSSVPGSCGGSFAPLCVSHERHCELDICTLSPYSNIIIFILREIVLGGAAGREDGELLNVVGTL